MMTVRIYDLRGLPTEIICEAQEIALEIKRTPGANAWTRLDLQGNPEALVIEFAEGGA